MKLDPGTKSPEFALFKRIWLRLLQDVDKNLNKQKICGHLLGGRTEAGETNVREPVNSGCGLLTRGNITVQRF